MPYTIAFYIHHHGSGHFMRSISIAKNLTENNVVFIGSNLEPYKNLIPEDVAVLDLPIDTPSDSDHNYNEDTEVDCFHYAPLNVAGISHRVAALTRFFMNSQPMILVVDVSVEITLLARLCGVPTIVMRQHGIRTDLPHRLAFQSAEMLIAPFSKQLETSTDGDVIDKTFYTGGFSRLERITSNVKVFNDQIAILIGQGGSSLNIENIFTITKQCPEFHFHVLGEVMLPTKHQDRNVTFHGITGVVEEVLARCGLAISNMGHNSVMEIAALNKAFIGIPEERPFDEQLDKARAMENIEGFVKVLPADISTSNWHALITKMLVTESKMIELINPNALKEIAEQISFLGKKLFNS